MQIYFAFLMFKNLFRLILNNIYNYLVYNKKRRIC